MFRGKFSFTQWERKRVSLTPSCTQIPNMKFLKCIEELIPCYAQHKNNRKVEISYVKMIYIMQSLLQGPHDFVLNVWMQSTLLNICSSCVMIRKCHTKIAPHLNQFKSKQNHHKRSKSYCFLRCPFKVPKGSFSFNASH